VRAGQVRVQNLDLVQAGDSRLLFGGGPRLPVGN